MKKQIMVDDDRKLIEALRKEQTTAINGKQISELKSHETIILLEWMANLLGLIDENGTLSVN